MIAGLENKVVVITGAANGIGAAAARQAAASCAAGLLLTDRDGDGCARLANEIGDSCEARAHTADLVGAGAGANVVAACVAAFGRVDGVVNAAGITDRASIAEGSLDDWDRLFAVNARAPFEIMQAAIRDMTGRSEPGSIVNIQSINAHCGAPAIGLYSASKAALAALTRNAAHAHMADLIRVNGINLGWTDTPSERVMQGDTLGLGPGWIEAVSVTKPWGRLLQPDEAARQIVWLLSDASAPLTGMCIDLDQYVVGQQ